MRINQASNQADPTNASTIYFVIFFSEPVTDFTADDITLSGSAGATTALISGDDGIRFGVDVTGMTQDGTVIASIPAAVAIDDEGNPNSASTSEDNVVQYLNQPVTVTINADCPFPPLLVLASAVLLVAIEGRQDN